MYIHMNNKSIYNKIVYCFIIPDSWNLVNERLIHLFYYDLYYYTTLNK